MPPLGYKKSHCKNGHERLPENLTTRNQCRICMAILNNEPKTKQKKAQWTINNREKLNKKGKDWATANPEKVKHTARLTNIKRAKILTKAYVAYHLGVSVKDAPPELIELKRQIILFRREIRNAGNRQSTGTNQ